MVAEHGPIKLGEVAKKIFSDQYCECCGQSLKRDIPRRVVAKAVRKLMYDGYVNHTIDRKLEANKLEELKPLPEPFGAGIGDTYEGDLPSDEPITVKYHNEG